ncbi:MAG: deoxyuridine 5'-triphosphate nucleotidohydrolase [Clostridia bacterium]|nr:deoxyuridine 5'-triphosphate nucleotidohydrolase [Clostridia bacterium]
MQRIAQFEKVSFNQFKTDWEDTFGKKENIEQIYNEIKIPHRATTGSAGYDFFAPLSFELKAGESMKIPTGIRVKINDGWVLKIYPRSGLGFKFRLQMNNTVGIIDSDYYSSDNEGHIFCKIMNDSNEGKTVSLEKGAGFCQGIFVEYGITFDDDVTDERNGGFGSTSKMQEGTIIDGGTF